ncbi:cupin domain-containing protein [uncultured Roseovarius sp.]|uniref:cupin domain-containing protein n=1 Tax=uncultured Roseovarius sp. TaxID=293344 RepID=UPI002619D439|nr:cupin domain-containing protein [uncultured Roseovarius sp.]
MEDRDFRLASHPATMVPSHLTPAETFTTDDRTETIHSAFETEDESILSGVWECAPCREEIDAYPVHEMMTVVSGSLTLTHADGRAETFTAGDTFFIAKGSKLTWEITETLRKFYMIAE